MQKAILFGSSSEIGRAILREFCQNDDWEIFRVGSVAAEMSESFSGNHDIFLDWNQPKIIENLSPQLENIEALDLVVISLGYLSIPDQQMSPNELIKNVNANLVWPILCLDYLNRNQLILDSTIFIVVSSSLVALPPTKKNFLYTILKSTLEQILKNAIRYSHINQNIIFLRPGYVQTKINIHLPPGKMPTSAEDVAKTLKSKVRSGLQSGVVYAPTRIGILAKFLGRIPTSFQRFILSKFQ